MSKKHRGAGYVYLMQMEGTPYYKIGLSTNPTDRLSQINHSVPINVVLLHTIAVVNMRDAEEWWHMVFRGKNVKGEWFNLEPRDVELFCKCNGKNTDELTHEAVFVHEYFKVK